MNLIIKNPKTLNEKINFFMNNMESFHVVTDFDWTLTQYFDDNWKSRPSLISLLYNEWILDDEYSEYAQSLFNHYVKIEHDTTLPLDTRQQAMEERWTKHKDILMKKWLNYNHLKMITSMNSIVMRQDTNILLEKLYNTNIPVIIFSASWIGVDSISLLLKHRWLNFPNIFIVSNKLYRNDQGKMIWYSKPVIHSLNKTESIIWANNEYKNIQDNIKNKPNAIIFWDGLHDSEMVDKKEWRTIINIGLCNNKVEEKIEQYSDSFDAVITHDFWFNQVINILWL